MDCIKSSRVGLIVLHVLKQQSHCILHRSEWAFKEAINEEYIRINGSWRKILLQLCNNLPGKHTVYFPLFFIFWVIKKQNHFTVPVQKCKILTVILSSFDSWWITMMSCPHPLQNVNKCSIAIPSSIYFGFNCKCFATTLPFCSKLRVFWTALRYLFHRCL